MKKIIFTADDFGVIPSINSGIINAINLNKVNSVAVLTNYEGSLTYNSSVSNIYRLMNETTKEVELGVHFTVTSGKPLTGEAAHSLCEGGYFREYTEFRREIDLVALYNELDAQVMIMKNVGFQPKWASNHHNVLTLFPEIFDVYMKVSRDHGLAIRSVNIQPEKDQNTYLLLLQLALLEDVHLKDLQELKSFAKEVVSYFSIYAHGLKSTDYMDISDYGPAPIIKILPSSVTRRVVKKLENIAYRLDLFNNSDFQNLEMVFHLIDADIHNVDPYKYIDYPGISRSYFDSRILEFEALKNFDFSGINIGNWEQLNAF